MMATEKVDYGNKVNEHTKKVIRDLNPKGTDTFDYYEERDVDTEVHNWIERSDIGFAVVVGDAGFGKTSLLCNLANELLNEEHYAVFFVQSERLIGEKFHKKILDDLDITEIDLDGFLRKLTDENRKVIFLLDTLDIIATDEGIEGLSDFITKVRRENVVVIGASRPLEFRSEIEDRTTKTFGLKPFSNDEIQCLFNKYKAVYEMEEVELSLPVLEICQNPLHMRMLFEVYQSHEIPKDINVQNLYDRYWYKKIVEIRRGELPHFDPEKKGEAERVKENLTKNIAYEMLTSKQIMLSESETEEIKGRMRKNCFYAKTNSTIIDSPHASIIHKINIEKLVSEYDDITAAAYHDLLHEGVLREQGGWIEFFHQSFFEYAVARALTEKRDEKWLEEFLSIENVEIQSLAVGILARNRHLDVYRTLDILGKIIKKDVSPHLTKRTIQYLSILGEEWLDYNICIMEYIVENKRYEYYWSVLVLIKDLGIESPEIIEILKKIATTQLTNLKWYNKRKEAFELLKKMGVNIFPEASKIDYLDELRQMTSEQALDYVKKLAHTDEDGATSMHLMGFDHNFLFFVLRELYKVYPSETCVLMKDFLVMLERSPFQHIYEILGEHEYFNPKIIRSFVESDNQLISLTGFMALEYALNKVVDGEVVDVDEKIRNEILRLLSEIKAEREKNPLLAAMAAVTYEEATNPPEPKRIRWGEIIRTGLVKGTVDSIGPRMAKNFMAAEDNEDKMYHVVMYWGTYRGMLHTKPDKLWEVFRVIGKDDRMFRRVCNFMYDQVRISPKGALDTLYKFALISEDSQIRVTAVDIANIVGRRVPEKVLEIYEKLLSLHEYQDNRTRLTLTHNFRNFLESSQEDRTRRNLEDLMSDEDREVSMLADIVLNGIKFRK